MYNDASTTYLEFDEETVVAGTLPPNTLAAGMKTRLVELGKETAEGVGFIFTFLTISDMDKLRIVDAVDRSVKDSFAERGRRGAINLINPVANWADAMGDNFSGGTSLGR